MATMFCVFQLFPSQGSGTDLRDVVLRPRPLGNSSHSILLNQRGR